MRNGDVLSFQPELIGRDKELTELKQHLEDAYHSQGSTIFISGEAGIGKTRLVSELINEAETKDIQLIQGWCLAESLEPLMPIKTALREAGLFHLISGDPPPLVVSTYLMNDAGLLIAKSEREASDLDPHIFASMLKAVGTFVKDSMQMIDHVERTGGLNILGYKDFKILIEEDDGLYLASVTKGSLSEFLVSDIRYILAEVQKSFGNVLSDWDGDLDKVEGVESIVARLVTSGKYSGRFLVDDPKVKQENLMDNVLFGIQRCSTEKPILLFLDDLQWADPSTLNMLHYLARNTKQYRMLIIGTFRPEDIIQSWEGKTHLLKTVMQNMNREDLLEKIELKRLNQASTEELVKYTFGTLDFTQTFLEKIYRETEGTPFYVLEIARLLVEEGCIGQNKEGVWRVVTDIDEMDIPSKVYDVVKRRLDRLMIEQREILECAAVMGEEFSTDVLEKTTDMQKLTLLKNLSEIEKTHRLIHYLKDKYKFDHAKVREVLYNGIGEELRMEYHRIIADTITEVHKDNLDGVVSELAHHYYQAGDERAGGYLIKVGDKAKENYANNEAIRLYNNALKTVKNEERQRDIHNNLGDIYSLTGGYGDAIENYLSAMEQEKDNRKKANIHRKIAWIHNKKGDFEKSLEECDKGLGLLSSEECTEVVGLLSVQGWTHIKTGDYDKASEMFTKALNSAKVLGDKKVIAQAHHDIGTIFYAKGEYNDALEHLKNAVVIREELVDIQGISGTLNNIGAVYLQKGDLDKALEYFEQGLCIGEKIGDKILISSMLNNIGALNILKGEFNKALDYNEKGLEICKNIGDKQGISLKFSNIGLIYYEKGDLETSLDYFEQYLSISEKIGDKWSIANSLSNIGNVYKVKGDMGKTFKYYEQSLEICRDIGEKRLYGVNHSYLAEAYLKNQNIQVALEYIGKALETAIETGGTEEEGESRRVLGMIYREMKDWKKSTEEFEKAKNIFENEGFKVYLAKLFYEYSLLHNAKGEPDKAKEHLEKALSMFEEMGMKLWEEKCRKALEEIEQSN